MLIEMPKVVPGYKEAARSRILKAAQQMFSEKGYHQTTMDDIARRLGVSKGALYLYFNSKEELFKGIYESAPRALGEIFDSAFSKGNPLDNAKVFFNRMMKQYASNPALSFEIFSEASRNAAVRKVLRRNYEEYTKTTMKFLERQTQGLINKYFDSRSLAQSLIALWNGMETLLVVGYPVREVEKAWIEAFKAMFAFAAPPIGPKRNCILCDNPVN